MAVPLSGDIDEIAGVKDKFSNFVMGDRQLEEKFQDLFSKYQLN